MSGSTLVLGATDLEEFVERESVANPGRKARVDEILEQYEGKGLDDIYDVEAVPWQHLMSEREAYKRIDPGFLSMSNVVESPAGRVRVPRFGVFTRTKDGFTGFGVGYSGSRVCLNGGGPRALREPLVRSTEPYKLSDSSGGAEIEKLEDYWINISKPRDKESRRKLKGLRDLGFKTKFRGLIPRETKEKITIAEKIFGEDEIYLVSEVRPEDWQVTRIQEGDPLILGVGRDNTVYLVDHFDTTPAEFQVERDFTLD